MVPRGVAVLQNVALIAAEDTRHSRKLLSYYRIHTPLESFHEHSGRRSLERILGRLRGGESVALICDAGTPLISDPGQRLVAAAHQEGIPVIPIPGANAAAAALSAAGLNAARFVFEGFLPAAATARRRRLKELREEPRTLVFYEAPHRIAALLGDLEGLFGGERRAVLARELSKRHETVCSDTLAGLAHRVVADEDQQRGEIVLVVAGAAPAAVKLDAGVRRTLEILAQSLPAGQAAALTAQISGVERRTLYQLLLEEDGASPEEGAAPP